MQHEITQAMLKERFDLAPDGNGFTYRKTLAKTAPAGGIVGTPSTRGGRQTRISGVFYQVSHLMWLWHYGELPSKHLPILHKDHDKANLRIENLVQGRLAEVKPRVRKVHPEMTAELVRVLFNCDYSKGTLTWKRDHGRNAKAGSEAGYVSQHSRGGYKLVETGGKAHPVHRLVWLHFYGEWPAVELDHINRNKLDNSIANLRSVTRLEQMQNLPTYKSNTSGLVGAYPRKNGKFQASVQYDGRNHYIGRFDTKEEAHAAYVAKKAALQAGNS